jgi:hypothetical protein
MGYRRDWGVEMIKKLFCRHEYYKVDYLGTEHFPGQFKGKYLVQCRKCGKEERSYGEPLFPLTGPPILHGKSKSEYDKSYHELKEEVRKTEAEIERLINLRNNLGYKSQIVEKAIRRNWRHIETCRIWMNHACKYEYRDKYREFFE